MMTPLEVVREIATDCERDVIAMQGQPLTGPNVAKWFGETLAMIQALAKVIETMLEDTKPVP